MLFCSTNCGIDVHVLTQWKPSVCRELNRSLSTSPVGTAVAHCTESNSEAAMFAQLDVNMMAMAWGCYMIHHPSSIDLEEGTSATFVGRVRPLADDDSPRNKLRC